MSGEDKQASSVAETSIKDYAENVVNKRASELLQTTATGDGTTTETKKVDRNSIVIELRDENLDPSSNPGESEVANINMGNLDLNSDPIVETRDSGDQVYKQPIFVRQYQQPTPEPVDIQLKEVIIRSKPHLPPIHVHVDPNKAKDAQRPPSPIVIRTAPPELPPSVSTSDAPIVYNKYIPDDTKPQPQQIIIHHHPELPPKPRPIVVEQWLPSKPPPKRITYHHVDRAAHQQEETERLRNRLIEYKRPNTVVEVEVVRLPVLKITPEEYYSRSADLTDIHNIFSATHNPDILFWRI